MTAVTEQRVCESHGLTVWVKRTTGYFRCRKCAVDAVDKRRKRIKVQSVEYLGGSCVRCGYDKYIGALEFHHRDPEEKDFAVMFGDVLGWEKIKSELNKCDLLCANCHREVHADIRENKVVS